MPTHPKETVAVIPSAGPGTRMGGPKKKNYTELLGAPVLVRTLLVFEGSESVNAVVVAAAPEDLDFVRTEIVSKYGLEKVIDVVAGASERQGSVSNALEAIDRMEREFEFIVVHDGARPLVTEEIIDDTLKAAYRTGAAICAVPVKDTIKEEADGEVKATLERSPLRSVQTPQAFRAALLHEAHAKAGKDGYIGTDESSLVERLGVKVSIVPGSYENLKITTPEDMIVAESILRARGTPDKC